MGAIPELLCALDALQRTYETYTSTVANSKASRDLAYYNGSIGMQA